MAEADRLTIAGGTPGIELMEKAGRGGRRCGRRAHPLGDRASSSSPARATMAATASSRARLLAERGYPVRRAAARRVARAEGRCGARPPRAGAGRSSRPRRTRSPAPALIVDALFGAGLDRPVEGRGARDDRGDQRERRRRRRGRPAERHQRRERRGDGRGGAGDARPSRSSAASPGICCCPGGCTAGRSSVADIGIPASVLDAIRAADLRQRAGAVGDAFPGAAARRPQIFARPRRGRVGRPSHRPARRGLRRAARCGPGRAWSRSRRPRDALAVNAAASLAVMVRRGRRRRRALRRCSPTRGSTRWCSAPAAASGAPMREHGAGGARRRARRSCSTPTR